MRDAVVSRQKRERERERERERQTDRQTDRQRETERQRQRQREMGWGGEKGGRKGDREEGGRERGRRKRRVREKGERDQTERYAEVDRQRGFLHANRETLSDGPEYAHTQQQTACPHTPNCNVNVKRTRQTSLSAGWRVCRGAA